jgi:hypothetical protein
MPRSGWSDFVADPDYVHLIDIIARSYGKLPSEIAKLDWTDIMICSKAVLTRSDRVKKVLKRAGKKNPPQSTLSVFDLADLL